MTKEEKELLLKDLCGRLPYGITIYRITDNSIHHIQYSDITENIDQFSHFLEYSGVDNIKPYLRPMSSMTDEEVNEWVKASNMKFDMEDGFLDAYDAHLSIDWLNKHHFDYRGLIPMGIALKAPEGMYKFN
jgi:hypothetical protein